MDFVDAIPITFKEITPNQNIPDKWIEVGLNTGGTHSTLQDIKLPQKAGGYWYLDSKRAHTRNRFIYWQTTPDALELSEASLDVNLTSADLRCKVATGTPPLNGVTIYERTSTQQVVILAATVSSVHRLIFPHPEVLDKRSLFGSMSTSTPSIFQDISAINHQNNYYILNQYSNQTTGVAHTCASLLKDNGEAVFALACGHSGEGGLLVVKLPVAGTAVITQLKRETTVPRFLSGITGALRGRNADSVESYGVCLTNDACVAACGDGVLRAWSLNDTAAPPIATQLTANAPPQATSHGHMLQKAAAPDGSTILVVYLSFPSECEFLVMKMSDSMKFSTICRIFGPQLDLVDFAVGYGDGGNVIWALWSQPDGQNIITSTSIGVECSWRAVWRKEDPPPLPMLSSHQAYKERVFAGGLLARSVQAKALVMYRRNWCASDSSMIDGCDLSEATVAAVQHRMRQLSARGNNQDHSHVMHKCWSDYYSWCMQYQEGLQKPLGFIVSKHGQDLESGWWCGVVRRSGISLLRQLEPLEQLMISPEIPISTNNSWRGVVSEAALRVAAAGARWERAASEYNDEGESMGVAGGADELERRLFAVNAPQHRLLPRLLLHQPSLSPQQIDDLTSILEPIKDLQSAVLELNEALRLDVPEWNNMKTDEEGSEYDNLFASDLGVAVVAEAIRQMAEMRSSAVRGALAALGVARASSGVPGAGHCAVHWQAFRALLWLCLAPVSDRPGNTLETFRLKLSSLASENSVDGPVRRPPPGCSVAAAYTGGAGGERARARLSADGAPTHWHRALPLMAYHVAHQLWAVSGGFDFGWWLGRIYQPRLVQQYVTMLEPWCEWNACSRQFVLGLSLLDLDDSEGAYTAFCKAAKGVSSEPFLRQLIAANDAPLTQHRALVLYYMKVIKLFEIHDAGACVVRLAETAISIADKDDPNLGMFQWVVFKWHVESGQLERAACAAAASLPSRARAPAAAMLVSAAAERKELGVLVSCSALAQEIERAASNRAKLHDAHTHNPYYDLLYAMHVHTHNYSRAAGVLYERAARCGAEVGSVASSARRRWLAAALACLRLCRDPLARLVRPAPADANGTRTLQVIGPDELASELREEDIYSLDPIQKSLLNNERIDFQKLYPQLKDANVDTLYSVTKRAIANDQFLPRWFLLRYLTVDGAGCTRTLLSGGRIVEAAEACCESLRTCLTGINSMAEPRRAPLALVDSLLLELKEHDSNPYVNQVLKELEALLKEYTDVVIRTSQDMKLAGSKLALVN